jgi:hypothetical protein
MTRRTACALVALALSAIAAKEPATPPPTPEERAELIRRAAVFAPTDVATKDLYNGPEGTLKLAVDQLVTCDFVPKVLRGWTEKFLCRMDDGRVFKVKYIEGDRYKEAVGEVLGTRLFWALGFYADRVIPVRVRCQQCPREPWRWVNARKNKGRTDADGTLRALPREAEVGTYTFDPATIEEPLDAEVIEEHKDQGWSWRVLDDVDASSGGATRAEIDAFKLLNAFVQNADNGHEQNSLVCPHGEGMESPGRATCRRPVLYVSDLGAVFGRGGGLTSYQGRVDYEGWKEREVWRDAGSCRARLAAIGFIVHPTGLIDPKIGEAGRALLAGLLARLSDQQIADLFRAARIDRLHQTMPDGAGGRREVTVADWVTLFKAKRDEITHHPGCPDP